MSFKLYTDHQELTVPSNHSPLIYQISPFYFSCEVCGKGFPQAYKLRNHRIIHERRGQSTREAVGGLLPYDSANIVGLEM